jgi:PLD-like domain
MQIIHFTDIATHIAAALRDAEHSINVNTPWLTDKHLFNLLVAKAESGLQVRLAIENDDINNASRIDYTDLVRAGGALYENDATHVQYALNHEKFAVIDSETVIFGSYNWTYRAANSNRESIIIIQDAAIAKQYLARFAANIAIPSVRAFVNEPLPFAEPLVFSTEIIDPSFALRLDIEVLEADIAGLLEEIAALESGMEAFMIAVRIAIYDLVAQKMSIEQSLAERRAAFTEKAADRAQAAQKKQDFEQTQAAFEEAQVRQKTIAQPIDADLLRKYYREAAFMTHPDRFQHDSALAEKANALMAQLAAAYQDKNLAVVQAIWQDLQDGIAFIGDNLYAFSTENLYALLQKLTTKKQVLTADLEALKASDTYRIMQQNPDVDAYIGGLMAQLKRDIDTLIRAL